MQQRRFTKEFEEEAVRLVQTSGRMRIERTRYPSLEMVWNWRILYVGIGAFSAVTGARLGPVPAMAGSPCASRLSDRG